MTNGGLWLSYYCGVIKRYTNTHTTMYAVIYTTNQSNERKCKEFNSLSSAERWAYTNYSRLGVCYIESPSGLEITPSFLY